jgi:hypothetical protein
MNASYGLAVLGFEIDALPQFVCENFVEMVEKLIGFRFDTRVLRAPVMSSRRNASAPQ